MRVGLYTVFSLLFVIGVAVATYMVNPGTFSFEVFGINMPKLPIAVWIALPVAILVIFSILHMMFYSTKNYFNIRKLKADAKKLEDGVYWSLIQEPTSVTYSSDEMKRSASILAESYITPNTLDSSSISDKIKDAAKVITKINSGEYVELNKQKFAKHLSENNPIEIKNNFNKLNSDPSFALKVIEFSDKYSNELLEVALDSVARKQDMYTLKKYAKVLGKDRFFLLLNRAESGEDIGFSSEMISSFIKEYSFDCKDYYKLAKATLGSFEPDSNLANFKTLQEDSDAAIPAYIYLLFKYEMLDKVRDILDDSSDDEYKALKAFYSLKKSKYNYKIDDILGSDSICK